MTKKRFSVHDMVAVGLMAALVFVFTYLHIDIPTPLTNTMLHLGNVMCLLASLLFGSVRGGLAAGLGSMIYDMMDPRYLPTCWLTFLMKFAMGWVCGKLCGGSKHPVRRTLSAAAGSATYVLLYVAKTFVTNRYVNGYELETVMATVATKGTTSAVNGIIAVVGAVLLCTAIYPALERAGLFKGQRG